MKRVIDVVVSAALLIALFPLLVGIAIAVKLTSAGPILYRWRVVGRDGRPFRSWKFRTMVADADERRSALATQNEVRGPAFKIPDDPRVTTVGRVLRRFSLDELPQLVTVLAGHMSLVGPRPPLETEYATYTPEQRRKLAVKPGLTGLWQISGRSDIRDFDERLALDLEYIERWSLWLDLRILARTVPAVLRGRGAY